MKTLIKICGIKRLDDLECAIQNGADLIGFVFVKSSPRYIEPSSVTNLLQSVPEKIKTVAVMQHATQNDLDSILDAFKPRYIQTDADDFLSLDLPSNIKKIRVYREQEDFDLSSIDDESLALLEGPISGSGQMVNKEFLKKACKRKRLLIAGGLSPENIHCILKEVKPYGVDVSSGVESSRGNKSKEKIIQFNKIVRTFDESKQ